MFSPSHICALAGETSPQNSPNSHLKIGSFLYKIFDYMLKNNSLWLYLMAQIRDMGPDPTRPEHTFDLQQIRGWSGSDSGTFWSKGEKIAKFGILKEIFRTQL